MHSMEDVHNSDMNVAFMHLNLAKEQLASSSNETINASQNRTSGAEKTSPPQQDQADEPEAQTNQTQQINIWYVRS